MPFWMGAIGGYTELATRIVVMGLAAMSLNFLLGFTGVLSFGHAAYFGLGAYGAAMAIKYLGVGSIPAIGLGVVVATIAAMIIGALIVRLRGVYFAMVTIAFGQVFYFIAFRWNAVTGGDDGLTGWHRLPIDFGFADASTLSERQGLLLFRASDFHDLRRRDGEAPRLALRALADRHSRERTARAIPWPADREPRLALLRDLVSLRQRRGRALRPAQQLY